MSKFKEFLGKCLKGIKDAFTWTDKKSKVVVPIAVNVVNDIKSFIDNPTSDVLFELSKLPIKGTADDLIIDKVHKWLHEKLPVALTGLVALNAGLKYPNPAEKIGYIIKAVSELPFNQKVQIWGGLAAELSFYLMDGKLSMEECFDLGQKIYNNIKTN